MATLLRRSALATLAAMALMLIAAPAFAEGKGYAKGSAVTEDTDSDGFANTPDPAGDTDNAHPSGNDKSAEAGGSGNQGSSGSTPDQDGKGPERDHEGTDKPGGSGGVDELDQDGNNGCGNDDDFEDDNEGWCGGKINPAKPATPATASFTGGGSYGAGSGTTGSGTSSMTLSGTPDAATAQTVVSDGSAMGDTDAPVQVLSGSAAASDPATAPVAVLASELAFTGLNLSSLLLVMGILGLLGGAVMLASRRRSRA